MLNNIAAAPTTDNWASLLQHILSSLGFHEVWVQQGVGNYNAFISVLKQRLIDIFIQNWRARLEGSRRTNVCKSFAVFQLQPYLDKVSISKFRHALRILHVSSHRLKVESGRWVKPIPTPFNERKCAHCSVLEDEFHFVLMCPVYLDLRKKYISKYYCV